MVMALGSSSGTTRAIWLLRVILILQVEEVISILQSSVPRVGGSQVTPDFWACVFVGHWSLVVVCERLCLHTEGFGGTLLREDRVRGNSWEPAVAHFQVKQRCSFGKENTHYWHVRAWSTADVNCTCEVCNGRSTSFVARGHMIKNDGEALRVCPTCPGLLARPSVIIPERWDCHLTTSSDGRQRILMWNGPPCLEMLPLIYLKHTFFSYCGKIYITRNLPF